VVLDAPVSDLHLRIASTTAPSQFDQPRANTSDQRWPLACGCVCPNFSDAGIARPGEVREWHFAHAGDSHCEGGTESALHLAAKQLLLESGGLSVPEIQVTMEAEKAIGAIRPDIVAVVVNSMLFVEIAVTHFVDTEKQAFLVGLGVPTLEIDLASFQSEKWTWELLSEYVIEHALNKRWVHLLAQDALSKEAHEAAMQAAMIQPIPISTHPKASPPAAVRTRFWISNRMVDAIERPFGIAVWSPYDPELNVLIK